MNSQITRLAVGLWWSCFSDPSAVRSGPAGAVPSPNSWGLMQFASAAAPKPQAERLKKWRRV